MSAAGWLVAEPRRRRDVRRLTLGELEQARRDLQTSLALTQPDSPGRRPMLAQLELIDTELAARAAGQTGPP
jgi:hypothetical protein